MEELAQTRAPTGRLPDGELRPGSPRGHTSVRAGAVKENLHGHWDRGSRDMGGKPLPAWP